MFQIQKNALSDDLKAHDKQVIREDTPLPSSSSGIISLFVGVKGSGKTSVILSLLKSKHSPYRKIYDRIYLFSPTGFKDKKLSPLVEELDEYGNYYPELSNDNLSEVLSKIEDFNREYIEEQLKDSDDEEEENLHPAVKGTPKLPEEEKPAKKSKPKILRDPRSLVILDDCIHAISDTKKGNPLKQLATQSRHFKTDLWISTQKYNALPVILRLQSDTLSCFKCHNEKEFQTISNDWSIDRELLKNVYDFATSEPNSFLHVSFFSGKPTFYKKYDKILI